jgi:hypothetical protein
VPAADAPKVLAVMQEARDFLQRHKVRAQRV